MTHPVEINLALILFLPWYLILSALYWVYPRQPRVAGRHLYDSLALVLALAASVVAMQWGYRHADPSFGGMWKQVLATAMSYGGFVGVIGFAFGARAYWLRRDPLIAAMPSVRRD